MSIGKRGLGQLAVSQAMWVSYVGEASGATRRGMDHWSGSNKGTPKARESRELGN